METTNTTFIQDIDILKYPKLELKQIEGDILYGKTIIINASGMEERSLRNAKDGTTYFGYSKFRDSSYSLLNDFIMNINNSITANILPDYKIYFDQNEKTYFLSLSDTLGSESLMFVKLSQPFKIVRKHIISLGDVHFSVEKDPSNLDLKLDFAFGDGETAAKSFSKYQVVKIGRGKDNDIVLENYAYSRLHTSLYFDSKQECWYVQDGMEKPSLNGTWVYLDWPWQIQENLNFRIGGNILSINIIKS